MLQLVNIAKQYRTADLVQNALDGVSLSLRDQEFVAILGPSGSGKTTLLNVIGGLDHYDSGDLIINGVSTKNFRDRDWDTYRNHSIGFVFQSYNLIPHQSVLANVELALTISGVSTMQRKKRAREALEKVGLKDHISKKPSQLSGGQMQRVAIARALVNDPEIVLADEPTGALDSDTSVQVMELLKEVSKDRLVVMVTHNPELAEQYATRIVRIRDGKVTDDTDPFVPGEEPAGPNRNTEDPAQGGFSGLTGSVSSNLDAEEKAVLLSSGIEVTRGGAKRGKYKKKKAAMSFLTALALSFNNLRTKKARTILVSIAGSIGIIGIAMIQSMSNGVNDYISDIEEKTVSQYPISISSTGINVAAYMTMFSEMNEKNKEGSDDVTINQVLHNYAGGLTNNDLKSLKAYIEDESGMDRYTRAIEYSYEITPNIYRKDSGTIRRIHPDESLDAMGMRFEQVSAMSLVAFFRLPENKNLYADQYDIKAGRWPENDNECVVVLGSDGSVTDITAYALGLKKSEDLDELIRKLMEGENVVPEEDPGIFSLDEIMGTGFKVINRCDRFAYDRENDFWTDKTSSGAFLEKLYKEAPDLTVVGIVREKEDADGSLESGIYYTSSLVKSLIVDAQDSEVVKEQISKRKINILNGRKFGETTDTDELELSELLDVDEEAVQNAFSFDADGLTINESMFEDMDLGDLSLEDLFDPESFSISPNIPEDKLNSLFEMLRLDASAEEIRDLFTEIIDGFWAGPALSYLSDVEELQEELNLYLQSQVVRDAVLDFARNVFSDAMEKIEIDPSVITDPETMADPQAFLYNLFSTVMNSLEVSDERLAELSKALADGFTQYFGELFFVPDPDELARQFSEYMASDAVREKISDFILQRFDAQGALDQFYDISDEVTSDIRLQIEDAIGGVITALTERLTEKITEEITAGIEAMIEDMSKQMEGAFSVDENALAEAFQFNMSEESIKDLITTMASDAATSYESNLLSMGYADLEDPESIMIYSKDFDSKGDIIGILDSYNDRMKKEDESKVITYSDIAGTMMSSVSSIINVISTVLIALVAISLIVSSIMIGVITYISVLERKKEIGILRALGASKRNVADVFNAETFITGLFAGLLGVITSALLTIPANWAIAEIAGHPEVQAYLDIRTAVLLVILSIVLNIISGFLPSRKASKSNPVTALRDE